MVDGGTAAARAMLPLTAHEQFPFHTNFIDHTSIKNIATSFPLLQFII